MRKEGRKLVRNEAEAMTHLLAYCPARLQPAFRAPFSGPITLTLTLVLTLPLTLTLSSLTCSNPNPNPLQPDLL